jgi:hypothetical protein
MAQRSAAKDLMASDAVVAIAGAKGGPAGALHCGGVWGQHAEAEAVSEAGPHLPSLELPGPEEGEGVEPGRGGGVAYDAEGAVDRLALRPLDC